MLFWRGGIRILLDTQTIILAHLGNLPGKIREILSGEEAELTISSASVKNTIGKLDMSEDEMRRALKEIQLSILPFGSRHALRMFSLPLHHRDPFDRMILATALVENLPIVSADRIFHRYGDAEVIW